MRQTLFCALFFIGFLSAILVAKSEKFTEIDDDGHEVEVKRFYIEGRQLSDGRRQCVETRRRKRSNTPSASYFDEFKNQKYKDEIATSPTTPATGVDTAVSIDEVDDAKDESSIGLIGVIDDDYDNDGEDENSALDGDGAFIGLPILAQVNHKNGEQSSVTAPSTGNNGIAIVQTNTPPKINPQTHALFELRPVNHEKPDGNEEDNYDDEDDNSQLLYEEELSPVSTTAIWSTGEDEPLNDQLDDLYDDYIDDHGHDNGINDGDTEVPTDELKPKPKPKPKPIPSNNPDKSSEGNKKKSSKKRPSKSEIKKKRAKQKRRRPGNKNQRHLPGKRGMGNNKRRRFRPHNQFRQQNRFQTDYRRNQNRGFRKKGNRRLNANLANRDIKRKNINKLDNVNQGTNTFTKTETLTQTGTANDEKDVNCIIINKTTTTRRPFWNILGRNVEDSGEELIDKHYGRRKRINFSIPV